MKKNTHQIDLSGKELTDDAKELRNLTSLYHIEAITEVDLSNNQFTKIPKQIFSFVNITSLDIRNNNFDDFQDVIKSLTQLKKLSHLIIDIGEQSEAVFTLDILPHIITLNGNPIKEESKTGDEENEEPEVECLDIDNNELKTLLIPESNKAFSQLIQKFSILSNTNESKDDENLNILFKQETNSIENYKEELPKYLYALKMIRSHNKLTKLLVTQSIEPQLKQSSSNEKDQLIIKLLYDLLHSNDSLIAMFGYLTPKMDKIQEAYESAIRSLNEMDDIDHNEEQLKILQKTNETLAKQLQEERNRLETKLETLETENRMMTERIFKKANTIVVGNDHTLETKSNHDTNILTARNDKMPIMTTIPKKEGCKEKVSCPSHQTKKITLKTLKDLINEMYTSKIEYDKRCWENKLPRETMEQHMYTYLNKRYGLKNLIIEWARNIISGIKTYSNEDSNVCLFGRIMRNEQEEESQFALIEINTMINEILSYNFKKKYYLKSMDEINKMIKQKKSSDLCEEEWKLIINEIYEEEERTNLKNKITAFIDKKNTKITIEAQNEKLTREEQLLLYQMPKSYNISFNDLTKIILDNYIRSRDKHLRNFVFLFRECDKDKNGILNEIEFTQLIKSFNLFPEESFNESLFGYLASIDPFNHQKITFSECVSLFNLEMPNEPGVSILDKLSLRTDIIIPDKTIRENTINNP